MSLHHKHRPPSIPVVAAFIKKQGQVLLGRRPEAHHLAGQWEFPGGKIELGEAPGRSSKKRAHGRAPIEAEIGAIQFSSTFSYNERGIIILFFDVLWKGEPQRSLSHRIKMG